jgi:hypothetical protein
VPTLVVLLVPGLIDWHEFDLWGFPLVERRAMCGESSHGGKARQRPKRTHPGSWMKTAASAIYCITATRLHVATDHRDLGHAFRKVRNAMLRFLLFYLVVLRAGGYLSVGMRMPPPSLTISSRTAWVQTTTRYIRGSRLLHWVRCSIC